MLPHWRRPRVLRCYRRTMHHRTSRSLPTTRQSLCVNAQIALLTRLAAPAVRYLKSQCRWLLKLHWGAPGSNRQCSTWLRVAGEFFRSAIPQQARQPYCTSRAFFGMCWTVPARGALKIAGRRKLRGWHVELLAARRPAPPSRIWGPMSIRQVAAHPPRSHSQPPERAVCFCW